MTIFALLVIQIDTDDLASVNPDEIEAMAGAGLPDNIIIMGSTIRERLDDELAST